MCSSLMKLDVNEVDINWRQKLPACFLWICFRTVLPLGIVAAVTPLCTLLETGPQPSATELLSPPYTMASDTITYFQQT